ncbi:hypothetical protein NNJEOMEG_01687 [Fundidesulfovibrio magnetotacticus]|uniref:Pyridoxal phosphate homeostasis protein n=1 Tax=Fundidesulfovibrio magnetotacticus TaxID=2730080 RepID=A0A6V8LTE5_9BACT|nr:YggS family pyridoxal phosphate-dependent enzyme [Fundidesulfovibrio magnetotacticus]GFK93851.1 hypothetical protein NNJEOMEG_01687 [Fundidesulfovibrio magnetotacticus]
MTVSLSPHERLERVRERIAAACARAGRDPASVTLVAVSKTHPAQAVGALARAGQTLFGESYVQEALPKMDALSPLGLSWHFIGKLQKNKVKYVAGRFELIHSVDSLELARVLHEKSSALGVRQGVLVQANLACEAAKSGCRPEDVESLAEAFEELPGLELRGLMLMPPWNEDPEANRGLFARARGLRERLSERLGRELPELSMGMSHDLETAVEEGATLVRVGTDLFGAREG